MGIEEFVQQRCGLHSGAAVLPAEGWGEQTGGADGEFRDAETDAMGLLRTWLGEALVGVEVRQLGVAEGVTCSLRSWLGAQLGALEMRLGEKLGEQTEKLTEEIENLGYSLGARMIGLEEKVEKLRAGLKGVDEELGGVVGEMSDRLGELEKWGGDVADGVNSLGAVSYTHLTLPTKA